MPRIYLILLLLVSPFPAMGQHGTPDQDQPLQAQASITFRDTLFEFAFDSTRHNLGLVAPVNVDKRLEKHFMYIGKDAVQIEKAWTGDPHYICDYPHQVLIPNEIYTFTVCFWHEGRQGPFLKQMGFFLSNGNRITLTFTGDYLPKPEK